MGVRVVFPDMGKDPSVQLIEKTITENGTYDAITDGANGYSKVNVNVEGGGESDFNKIDVTLEVSGKGNGANYDQLLTDSDGNATALIIETEQVPSGERRKFTVDTYIEDFVAYNAPITKEVYLYQNNYFMVSTSSVNTAEGYTITGDAEVESVEYEGETLLAVKVYGNCTISVVGRK